MFNDDRNPLSIYNEDSVYCLIFSDNVIAWVIYISTAAIQVLAFYVFLNTLNFHDSDTVWQFPYRCPENSLECNNEGSRSTFAWIMLAIVIMLFLGADVFDSMFQLRKAAALLDLRLFISGLILFFLTALAFFTSVMFNTAVAESDTDLIMNAVILLFINELDEQFLNLLDSLVPFWIAKRYVEIEKYMLSRTRGEEVQHVLGIDASSRLEKPRFAGVRQLSNQSLVVNPTEPRDRRDSGLLMLGIIGSKTDIVAARSRRRIWEEDETQL